jgi:hypothetical protein
LIKRYKRTIKMRQLPLRRCLKHVEQPKGLAAVNESSGFGKSKNNQSHADPQATESEDVHTGSMRALCYAKMNAR